MVNDQVPDLVDGGVGREEVEVLGALHVPHVHALALAQHHRQRVVVVRAVVILRDIHHRGGGVGKAAHPVARQSEVQVLCAAK
jgi:6,7-dimethyl-8-ribityllumazine synthase